MTFPPGLLHLLQYIQAEQAQIKNCELLHRLRMKEGVQKKNRKSGLHTSRVHRFAVQAPPFALLQALWEIMGWRMDYGGLPSASRIFLLAPEKPSCDRALQGASFAP